MTTLWGSKKNGNGDQNGEEGSGMARNSHEATERDRLLPESNNRRSTRSDGYLDPDDPAVCRISSFRR